jgi:hypothetical protein
MIYSKWSFISANIIIQILALRKEYELRVQIESNKAVLKRYNFIPIALDMKTITCREAGFDCDYVVKG